MTTQHYTFTALTLTQTKNVVHSNWHERLLVLPEKS